MRFKIDEQLPVEVAQALRDSGYDSHTVDEENMSGASDAEIAQLCQRETRALITMDLGFADIRTYSPSEYLGIIVLRPTRQDKLTVLRIIDRLLPVLLESSPERLLWIVDDQRIRVRE
jgi:predicted nuclease of predicted toxin-antitoxin system